MLLKLTLAPTESLLQSVQSSKLQYLRNEEVASDWHPKMTEEA